jgi:mannose-6-phosphate isomerase-like protein (cupin superfamily)
MTKKHLVLEDDVYLKLKKRKAHTSLSEKAIGNALLRSSLSRALLPDIIGQKLVESHKITQGEFTQAVEAALYELQEAAHPFAKIIKRTKTGSLVSGSWEFSECARSKDGAFQILECWARDSRNRAMPCHVHEETEIAVVVSGKVEIRLEGMIKILGPGESLSIPSQQIHTSAPLTTDTRLLMISTPAIARLDDMPPK